MSLIFDRRAELGGSAACHAFVVGVGAYPHLLGGQGSTAQLNFGLSQLSPAVVSARTICEWLKSAKLAKPLATIRLLLSDVEGTSPEAGRATLDGFLRDAAGWREDAAQNPENMTFFYFAGQGFSLSQGEHVVMLQDYGDGIGPALRNTVKVNNIVDGMSPASLSSIGRTQLYFIDANRRRPTALQSYTSLLPTAVFDCPPFGMDDRATAVFYAASPDSDAYADVKEGETFFSQALMSCLEGGAADQLADGRWGVSIRWLSEKLPRRVADLASDAGVRQQVVIEGTLREAVISYLDEAPLVDVTLHLDFAGDPATAVARLANDEGTVVAEWDAAQSSPPPIQVPAGLYLLNVEGQLSTGAPFKLSRAREARAPRSEWRVKLQ
jgi:hypothetical protein